MRATSLGTVGALMLALACFVPRPAFAQLGALVSPGRLSKAHASLEGIAGCLSCHAAGQGVSAAKCLTCHKPVAERIAQKRGVHRAVTTDCVKCHVEHAGVDGELRPFDAARFNHAAETRFTLDGLHAPLAANCAACHKTRSFLAVTASCASCHTDAHKGSLGTQCATCHTTAVKFTDTRKGFDHARTQFPLTGAHAGVTCASCHKNNTYKGVAFATCASCHSDPHQQSFGTGCASCHTTQGWRSARVDHSRTSFPLKGLHAAVECAKCHVKPATQVKLRVTGCATCHADPHQGTFKQDCASCHTEAGFKKGSFDHSSTRFPLVDKHAGLTCAACHQDTAAVAAVSARGVVPLSGRGRPASARGLPPAALAVRDFRGLQTACASCHADVHQGELGATCESCHSARSFDVAPFTHQRQRAFFAGRHTTLRCAQCHRPAAGPAIATAASAGKIAPRTPPRMAHVGLVRTSDGCATCHSDVHAGQLGAACERCHTLEAPKFAVASFAHDNTRFPLTGKHAPVACASCHRVETAAYPAGTATARHFAGVGTQCAACHQDPHASQLTQGCQTCHSTDTFAVSRYSHQRARARDSFFTGRHLTPRCSQCHKPLPRPAAPAAGMAAQNGRVAVLVDYRVTTTCTSCHTDVHKGGLGPRCESCHKP